MGVPRQVVLTTAEVRPLLAVTPVTEAALGPALSAAACVAFDLSRQSPLRAHLFVLDDGIAADHVLLLVLHHIAADGASLRPLLRDLSALYRARCEGGMAALPALPVQYADYTLWQRAALGEGDNDPCQA